MKKLIIAATICILLLLMGYAGYRGYQVWRERHFLAMAKDYLAKADYENESLSLQKALQANPRNLEALQYMAALAEAVRSPAALIYRQRILALNPQSADDRLKLAQTALSFQEYALATNTMAGMDAAGRNTSAWHNLAGTIALKLNQTEAAAQHFTEAIRLDPSNPILQINLAVMRLNGTNDLDRSEARISLQRVSQTTTNFALHSLALRELVKDAMRTGDRPSALAFSDTLVQPTNTLFTDKLLRLEVLQATTNANFGTELQRYQSDAALHAAALPEMTTWMMIHLSSAAALAWLQSLPPSLQTNLPAALLAGQCQVLTSNWTGLQTALTNQNWGDQDYIRHAFTSRALREQKMTATAAAEWELAKKLASPKKNTLISLFRLAAQWSWDTEAEDSLWIIFNRYPEEPWAGELLQQALIAEGRTRSLMQLLNTRLKRNPDDLELKNDLAVTALLLGATEMDPNQLAQEAYKASPTNAAYASTYALALYQQKKYDEALKLMQKLPPEQLQQPGVAGYYALLLKAQGDSAKAETYFKLAERTRLLPEEKKLFNQARNQPK